MSIFLIDYENVHTSAFAGLEALSEEDRVVVFYTQNSDTLTFSLMQRLMKAKARIDYLRVASGGKNSLDFQLCSYLGFLIGTHRDTRFCIVSRDKGFTSMLSFWNGNMENNNFVVCCPNIRLGERVTKPENNAEEVIDEVSAEEITPTEVAAEEITPTENIPAEITSAETIPEETAIEEAPVQVEEAHEQEVPAVESAAEDKSAESGPEQPAPEEKPAEKPKRKYNRRTPYKRKPKAPEEQTA